MSGPAAADAAYACVSLLVDELVRGGVRHVCVTPGSRSTPIALAVSRREDVRLHVHLDERSSAFFALGVAKATGVPAVALCTSGTAAANHLPAIIEASQARVPLIVITADRPPELRDTGANQTIDQARLFGAYPRWSFDTGVPELHERAARYWRSLGARALSAATGVPAGPVHLNIPFREPLVPSATTLDLGADALGRPHGAPWERVAATVAAVRDDASAAAAAQLVRAERGVIVAGTLARPCEEILTLANALRWPLIAEPGSGLRVATDASGNRAPALAAGQPLVADTGFRASHRPDVALQFGAAPTTRAAQALIREAGTLVVVDPDLVHADPERRASLTLPCEPREAAQLLLNQREFRDATAWWDSWFAADRAARSALDVLLDSWDEPFEGRVARDCAAWLPAASILFAASSMPVRDLDHYASPRQDLTVLSNRGASGIDGTVSTVLGIAAGGLPTYALIGDLALLHDAAGLLWSAQREEQAVLVVLDNNGGGIFSLLPQAELPAAEFETLFGTPHNLDLATLVQAAGAGYRAVRSATDLIPALEEATKAGGVQLVHVPVDRRRAVQLRKLVADRVAAALA